jgi:RNA polymerase sigma factor (sigma-70 family)
LEASALTHASRRGLLARRSPLLRLEEDERLVALIRAGHDRAFEVLFDRYHSRLLAFCNSMLRSRQDAEDVLQEVFANAHRAMLADERRINVRPWLYRIARNRCLNHLRKPVPEGQDSMDIHAHDHGTSTAEQVQRREDLRLLLSDVETLPETQRTALLLREIDQLTYEEIAVAMETTVPAVKSLLVRARIALAESSEARTLSCDEVRVELAEAAEGIRKASGPVRKHVRDCESCGRFREQLRSDRKALAAVLPLGPLAALKAGVVAKLFGGGGAAGGSSAAAGALGTTAAGGTAAGGLSALGSAIGAKAAVGVATAALLTAGAVEVRGGGAEGTAEPLAKAGVLERALADPLPPQHARPQAGNRNFRARMVAGLPATERPEPARAAGRDEGESATATSQAGEAPDGTSAPAASAPATGSRPDGNSAPAGEEAVLEGETGEDAVVVEEPSPGHGRPGDGTSGPAPEPTPTEPEPSPGPISPPPVVTPPPPAPQQPAPPATGPAAP